MSTILFFSAQPPSDSLIRELTTAGHISLHASSLHELIEKTRTQRPHLIVIDLLQDRLAAIEALGAIRSFNKDTLIITTGQKTNGKQKELPALETLGIHTHLTEPITPKLLANLINQSQAAQNH